jgi:hypothetical protein
MQTNDHSNESAMPVGSFVFHYFKVEVHVFVDASHRYGKLCNPFLFLLMLRDRVQATRNKCKGCLFVG